MSYNVNVKIIKQIFARDDYRIFGCKLLKPNKEIQLNNYGNITITGSLPFLSEGKDYELNIEEDIVNPRFGLQYKVLSAPSIEVNQEITDESEFEILCSITTTSQARYVHEAYPNFVRLILNGEEDKIDVKKIYNVGEIRLEIYKREINAKFKYYQLMVNLKQYSLSIKECTKLCDQFKTIEEVQKQIEKNPYYIFIDILEKSWDYTDDFLRNIRPELKLSDQRTEYLILHILDQNEQEGNTYINANEMAQYCHAIAPELTSKLKTVAVGSYFINYDESTKNISKMSTHMAECDIANEIKRLLKEPKDLGIDWKKYNNVDGFEMTEEQQELLRLANEQNIGILLGSAGCVDCDTEYFNGYEWKRIADYTEGEKVLQYSLDGKATLIIPEQYHKYPCDYLYHFETKYGINQTISEEHRIVVRSPKGVIKETNIHNIIQKQKEKGFHDKFITTFNYDGRGIELTDEQIRVMCAVICDGSFYSSATPNRNSYNTCRFNIKKERKKERLRLLFQQAKIEWREKKSTAEGYTEFYIKTPRREKEFTSYWYNCSQHQLQVICDEILFWDRHLSVTKKGKVRKSFSTCVKQTADFIQFAFSAIRKRAVIGVFDRRGSSKVSKSNGKKYYRKSIEYEVSITDRIYCGLCGDNRVDHNKTPITLEKTADGYKYCFTVPTSMLVLRRDNKIFISGNSGKSSSVKGLITMLDDNNLTYTLVAPTGVASRRLSTATGRNAGTIHKVLKFSSEKVNTDFLIVDEFSMCGVDLTQTIFSSLREHTKLILICDNHQLPSISCGNCLQDMINSNLIPMITLTKIFRYGQGGIATVATDVRNGKKYLDAEGLPKFLNADKIKDYKFIKISDDPLEQIVKYYNELLEKYSYKDITILSPFNIGSFGSYAINNAIQAEHNPPLPNKKQLSYKRSGTEICFRVGDKVINTVNTYDAMTQEKFEFENKMVDLLSDDGFSEEVLQRPTKVDLMNGEMGYVRSIDEENNMFVQFDENIIVFNRGNIQNLLLGTCISTHKSQGSENKVIINITHPQHKKMLCRELLYVANSRARELLIEIGDTETISNALDLRITENRRTMLKDLLLKEEN